MLGIDFGAGCLQFAERQADNTISVVKPNLSKRIVFVTPEEFSPSDGVSQLDITSVKRLLDFERIVPASASGMNSLDYLAGLIRDTVLGSISNENDIYAVFPVPTCFSQRQRSSLLTAARNAGLAHVRLMDDTLSALLAAKQYLQKHDTAMVFSWGSGSCSTGIYQTKNGSFELIGLDGDRNFGGNDIDSYFSELIVSALNEKFGNEWRGAGISSLRLSEESKRVKHLANIGEDVSILLCDLLKPGNTNRLGSQSIILSGEICQSVLNNFVARAVNHAERMLNTENCPCPDAIVLSGGMTKIPILRKNLQERYRVQLIDTSDDAVAVGSVLYGEAIGHAAWSGNSQFTEKKEHALNQKNQKASYRKWADHFIPFLDQAQKSEEMGKPEEAVEVFERLFSELYKFSSPLYRRVASLALAEGKLSKAFALLFQAHTQNPSDEILSFDFINVCVRSAAQDLNEKKYDSTLQKAVKGISAIKKLSQSNEAVRELLAQLLYLRGCALYQLGRFGEAEKSLMEAITQSPSENRYMDALAAVRKHQSKESKPMTRSSHHNDRNKPCSCGSGKKFKKCCGSVKPSQ